MGNRADRPDTAQNVLDDVVVEGLAFGDFQGSSGQTMADAYLFIQAGYIYHG